MDSPTPRLDFAVIGHQDSWDNIHSFVNGIRTTKDGDLSMEKVKNIFPFIPARDLFRVCVKSKTGQEINGIYIDTFIEPDKLGLQYVRPNVKKVKAAIACAIKKAAAIVALGGFTSIVLEGNLGSFSTGVTKFTTGNTLTTAFIVKGIEAAAKQREVDLNTATVLVIGATGDIGRACVGFLKHKSKRMLLCARNQKRLNLLGAQLTEEGIDILCSTTLSDLLPEADVVICVASSTGLVFSNCKEQVIICDAGYPKNLDKEVEGDANFVFHGGMGQVSCGYEFKPDYSGSFYKYPAPFVIHGCILEAMVLAFEEKIENYSIGKGNITTDKIEEIYALGLKHGIIMAPFYNNNGLC